MILITGASGFIGSFLAAHLANRFSVVCASRQRLLDKNWRFHDLNQPVDEHLFDGITAIVHCAQDQVNRANASNVLGTIELMTLASAKGIKNQIYLSSISAVPGTRSEYGQGKIKVEEFCRANQICILRPGLVIGPGGLFASIAKIFAKFWIVPYLSSKKIELKVIGIDDLVRAIEISLVKKLNGAYNLHYENSTNLKGLLQALQRSSQNSKLLIPIPLRLFFFALRVANALKITSISTDSVHGLTQDSSDLGPSHLESMFAIQSTLDESVTKFLHGQSLMI